MRSISLSSSSSRASLATCRTVSRVMAMMSGAQASIPACFLHSTRCPAIVYPVLMLPATRNTAQCGFTSRMAQGGGYPPPGGYHPPGPGGYGPPPGPGGYGPPGGGGYGPPGPGGYGRPAKPITGSPATMALHAMTIDPRTGLPRGEKPPASIAAVVALVCGILVCLGPLTGIPAIIAGIIARNAAREHPESVGGGSMAIAGIVLGSANLVLSALLLSWVAVFGLGAP